MPSRFEVELADVTLRYRTHVVDLDGDACPACGKSLTSAGLVQYAFLEQSDLAELQPDGPKGGSLTVSLSDDDDEGSPQEPPPGRDPHPTTICCRACGAELAAGTWNVDFDPRTSERHP